MMKGGVQALIAENISLHEDAFFTPTHPKPRRITMKSQQLFVFACGVFLLPFGITASVAPTSEAASDKPIN